ncbi:MAG: hypothetical protein CR985_02880 [Flavobacteriales bacterium]|nr:MAG: hypothetical protein CR985_02880 [Flavobacteriales bacterium]
MFYRISNIAGREELEFHFNRKFDFPNIYFPKVVLNGLEETTLSIITSEKPECISYGIWGLLPEDFDENWYVFQNISNTLNTDLEHLEYTEALYNTSVIKRRCLILATGFFTAYLYQKKMYPYYIHLTDEQPFCFAGIYNQLEDGFLTCSLLISDNAGYLADIPHIQSKLPVVLSPRNYGNWLEDDLSVDAIDVMLESQKKMKFKSYPISREFYNMKNPGMEILNPILLYNNP